MLPVKSLCSLVLLCHVCVGSHVTDSEWKQFKQDFKKIYIEEKEDELRRGIFEFNVKHINQHNFEAYRGDHSYRLGVNQFADLTFDERRTRRSPNSKLPDSKYCTAKPQYAPGTIPESVDWRTKGVVTGVKNEGDCGSPWAFSALGPLESREAIKCFPHKLVALSEQNLIDCSSSYGNFGCDGGWMDSSFGYIIDNRGIDTAESYPYTGKVGKCVFDPLTVGARLKGCVDLPKGNESALQNIVYVSGPVSAGINSALSTFDFYKSGIYDDPKCTPDHLDHAVVVVGFGVSGGKKYWIAKNSWGADWGDRGYIYIARDHGNECGIATAASYPEVLCDS